MPAMQLTGFTVLVVEDDVDNLEMLISHLEQAGALVLGAESVKVALITLLQHVYEIRRAAEHDIDALLCALELPDGDGCALLQKLRSRAGFGDLPAIALTGYSDAMWRGKVADCGFNHYAVKPFSLETVTDWLSELIDRRSGSGPVGMSCHAEADPAVRGLRGR